MPLRPVANPPNPWATSLVEYLEEPPPEARLQIFEDHSRSILSKNESDDIGFRWSVNPYRGCYHACAYCYARPYHEYLGFGAGTDFDRKIVVKPDAANLLREAFERRSWQGETVVFSGATDCYQPAEASYGLTRACLEVCVAYRNPVGIVTKAPLIERDIDVLQSLGQVTSVVVAISLPFFNEAHARAVEPYVAKPSRRLRTIARLAEAGISVAVLMAPVIPGLTDADVGSLLEAAAHAGAQRAYYGMLHLPGSSLQVFTDRIRAALPLQADRILARTREVRGGTLDPGDSRARMTGIGPYADMFRQLFNAQARRLGLVGEPLQALHRDTFCRPNRDRQLRLFPT